MIRWLLSNILSIHEIDKIFDNKEEYDKIELFMK